MQPAVAIADSAFDRDITDPETDSESDAADGTPTPRTAKFGPTVPRALSGSPKKSANAPLDPQRPQVGMIFNTLEEAVHFVYEYERRRGYEWKKGESERNKEGRNHVSFFW
jgi:hypothetical protein